MSNPGHPHKYLHTEGEYRGALSGHLTVLDWDKTLQKYRVQVDTSTSHNLWSVGKTIYITYMTPFEMDRDYYPCILNKPLCECGAYKTNQPGHSWYCPAFRKD